jgi:hypothetical protein
MCTCARRPTVSCLRLTPVHADSGACVRARTQIVFLLVGREVGGKHHAGRVHLLLFIAPARPLAPRATVVAPRSPTAAAAATATTTAARVERPAHRCRRRHRRGRQREARHLHLVGFGVCLYLCSQRDSKWCMAGKGTRTPPPPAYRSPGTRAQGARGAGPVFNAYPWVCASHHQLPAAAPCPKHQRRRAACSKACPPRSAAHCPSLSLSLCVRLRLTQAARAARAALGEQQRRQWWWWDGRASCGCRTSRGA